MNASLLPASDTRIPGRWLLLGRVTWVVVTMMVVGLTAAGLPVLSASLHSVCPQATCDYEFTAAQIQQLQRFGVSVGFLAYFLTGLLALVSAAYVLVAFVIFRRQSDRWIGLLGAFTLVLFGAMSVTEIASVIARAYPTLVPLAFSLDYLGIVLFPLFVFLFPDGRLNPLWTIGVVAVWAVLLFPVYFFPQSPFNMNGWPDWIQSIIWAGLIGSLILVQYYRYRRVYGPVLRQQTKWVVYGLAVGLGGFLATGIAFSAAPSIFDQNQIIVIIFGNVVLTVMMLVIPVSIAIAILRYRLWDIDLIINRTLVYFPLTAILAGLSSATITLFQRLFVATTGQKSDAVYVMATLVIVAAFTPIKNGLQLAVDKRFKDPTDPLKELRALDNQVRSVVEVLDPHLITLRLLNTATTAVHASGGAVYLEHSGREIVAHATVGWKDEDRKMSLPLEWHGKRIGLLCLGAREAGVEYSRQELEVLQQTANRVAQAVAGLTTEPIEE